MGGSERSLACQLRPGPRGPARGVGTTGPGGGSVTAVPYRLIYIGLGLLVIAAVALGAALARDGQTIELPGPIESVSPAPGARVIRQAVVEVDLEVGYEATVFINGSPVPDATFVEGTGVYSWSPSPGSPIMNEWTPGEHTVRVEWRRITGTPDFGEFEWTFRVQ